MNISKAYSYSIDLNEPIRDIEALLILVSQMRCVFPDMIAFRRRTSFKDVPKVSGQATRAAAYLVSITVMRIIKLNLYPVPVRYR